MTIKLMKQTFAHENQTKKVLCDFIMKAEQLSMGEKVIEFEKAFAKYQGRKYAVMFNSGSSANLALISAMKEMKLIKERSNIAFSALTWATNVMPIIQNSFKPIPIDIELKNFNMSYNELKKEFNKRKISCVFLTNLLGFCSNIDKIKELCDRNKAILIEDNCESLGSEYKGKKLGNWGFASTFSTFVGHHLSTIEGGLVCTDDEELYNILKMVRAHGWIRNLDVAEQKKYKNHYKISDFTDKYTFYINAYNLRPTELNAVIGLEELKYIQERNEKREKNFYLFNEYVNNNIKIVPLKIDMDFVSNFAYPLFFYFEEDFKKYKDRFEKAGVEIRPIVGGNMTEQPFFNKCRKKSRHPISSAVFNTGFYFPNNPDLTKEEIKKICECLK